MELLGETVIGKMRRVDRNLWEIKEFFYLFLVG